jgi:hypothetical protein
MSAGNGGAAAGGADGVDAGSGACANGIKDGSETDVDCGGGDCPACEDGKKCAEDADCLGGECSLRLTGRVCQD